MYVWGAKRESFAPKNLPEDDVKFYRSFIKTLVAKPAMAKHLLRQRSLLWAHTSTQIVANLGQSSPLYFRRLFFAEIESSKEVEI